MKLKTLTLLVLFILGFNTLFAQTTIVTYLRNPNVEYQLRNQKSPEIRERVTKHLLSNVKTFELVHSKGISIYEESKINPKLSQDPKAQLEGDKNIYFKNFLTSLFLRETSLAQKDYLIKDSIINYNWKFFSEEKMIAGYLCKKATTLLNNEVITIWFTNELEINDGPMEFWLSSGLILELITNNFIASATSISKEKNETQLKKPNQGLVIKQNEYNEILKNYKKSFMLGN